MWLLSNSNMEERHNQNLSHVTMLQTNILGFLFKFLFFFWKGEIYSKRLREEDFPDAGSLPKCPQKQGLGHTKAKSHWELNLVGLLSGWQCPKYLSYHLLLPMVHSRNLELGVQPGLETWQSDVRCGCPHWCLKSEYQMPTLFLIFEKL